MLNWYKPNPNSHDKPKSKPQVPDVTTVHELVWKKRGRAHRCSFQSHIYFLHFVQTSHKIVNMRCEIWEISPWNRTKFCVHQMSATDIFNSTKTNFWWLAILMIIDVRSWTNDIISNCKRGHSHQWLRHCNPRHIHPHFCTVLFSITFKACTELIHIL